MQAAKRVCNAVPTHDLNIWIKALWALAWAWQSFVGPQVGATGLGGLWALEWAWLTEPTNCFNCETSCFKISRICSLNPNIVAFKISEITALIRTDRRTDGQTDMASEPDQEYTY